MILFVSFINHYFIFHDTFFQNMLRISRQLRPYITTQPVLGYFSTSPQVLEPPQPDTLCKVVELELRGNDPAVLKSFVTFATTAGHHLNLESKKYVL